MYSHALLVLNQPHTKALTADYMLNSRQQPMLMGSQYFGHYKVNSNLHSIYRVTLQKLRRKMFSPFYDEKFANLQETFNAGMPILEKRTIGLIIRFSRIAYGQSKQPTNVCV